MKELIFKICLVVSFFVSTMSFAQSLNKNSLLSELNNTNGVSLNAQEKASYEKANADLATGLFNMDKKNLPKDQRDKEIDNLFDKRNNSLKSTLGPGKSSGLTKNINQTKRKIKLAKLVL
ncbi:hypothetical protein [Flavobacterium agrisoli]|uniref:Uncharacterized protein n=1 Tax=Flavobacterium agrisoli TaxID=2793066 RepID=A0A934PK29_9FLAO|nr:hypothetical protein [Flavobacterium agrisoli]MBK0369052.1 hypothetical protein [Flavobacterium agrisoli]